MPPIDRDPATIRAAVTHIQSLQWYYRCTLMPVVVVAIALGILGAACGLPGWLQPVQLISFAVAIVYSLFLVVLLRWSTCPLCRGWFFNLWASKGAANRDYSDRDRCNACGARIEDMLSAGDSEANKSA